MMLLCRVDSDSELFPKLLDLGFAEAVLQVMSTHFGNADIVEQCCAFARNVSDDNEDRRQEKAQLIWVFSAIHLYNRLIHLFG